jgi:hypothetical protein
MNKKASATYRYDAAAPSSLVFFGAYHYVIFLIVILVLFLAIAVHWTFLFLLVVLLIATSVSKGRNRSITLDSKFLVICGKVIWYHNIEKIIIDKGKQEMLVKTKDSPVILINSTHFPTNARKDVKIQKNKAGKFFKTSEKIIGKVKAISPQTQILIK